MARVACVLHCAWSSLLEAASRREEHPVETASLRLLIHKTGVGAIIGRAGATIKVGRDETIRTERTLMANAAGLSAGMQANAAYIDRERDRERLTCP